MLVRITSTAGNPIVYDMHEDPRRDWVSIRAYGSHVATKLSDGWHMRGVLVTDPDKIEALESVVFIEEGDK